MPRIGMGMGLGTRRTGSAGALPLFLRPVATRVKPTFVNTHGSDGVNTQGKFRVRHKVLPGGCASGLKLDYTNKCSEANGFNSITVAGRIRYPAASGTWYPVTFASAANVTITAGGADVRSDTVAGLPAMAAGDFFDEECYVTVASAGMKWPSIDNMALAAANGEGLQLATTDISGANPANADSGATEIYCAIGIVGQSTATRAIAIMGDSIANGAQDTITADAMGFIERKFNATYPTLNLATSSERVSQFVTAHTRRMAQMMASGITDIVFAYGTNDVAGSDTYTVMRGNMLSALALIAAQGKAITICPILVKAAGDVNTPAAGFTVGGIADQVNTLISGDMGLVSKFWDTRAGWQNGSNQILSATYTADLLHPNAVGNAAVAAVGGAANTLIAAVVPSDPIPSAWFTANWLYFRPASLALNDNDQITTWTDTRGLATATWAGEKPKYRTGMTPTGKPTVKFDIAGTGLEKLVIPKGALVDNIFGTFGAVYTVSRYATAGGNGTGRMWTKGVGETEALTTATNMRTTVDFVTADGALNAVTAANTWYVREVYCNASNACNLLQNSLNVATAGPATGTGGHVDNSANDFIIGNHDTLTRGWDGDLAALAIFKGTTATADQLYCAQAYLRADTGVTII